MYSVFKQLGTGEFQRVASCDDLKRAAELVDSLKGFWPGEYAVRDSEGHEAGAAPHFRLPDSANATAKTSSPRPIAKRR